MNLQQTPFRSTRSALACAALLAGLGALSTPALAAPSADERAEIEATYQAERQACLDGTSPQPRAACLDEARSVRRDALSGAIGNWPEPDYTANVMMRCDMVPVDAYADCIRRTQEGTEVGSVEEGAILRELPPVTVAAAEVPAEPAPTLTAGLMTEPAPVEAPAEPVAGTSAAMPDVGSLGVVEAEAAVGTQARQTAEVEGAPLANQPAALNTAPVQPVEQGGTPD